MQWALDTQNLHPTTELSLLALERLQNHEDFSTILDVGCGGGILAITAAHIWDAQVLAVDISPNAVADTQKAIAGYGLQERVTARRSDGFSDPETGKRAPYDLIICNLLADILVRLAPDVKKHLKPGGYAILSGSLAWLAENVEKTYKDTGFEVIEKFEISPWHAWALRLTQ